MFLSRINSLSVLCRLTKQVKETESTPERHFARGANVVLQWHTVDQDAREQTFPDRRFGPDPDIRKQTDRGL
jgi:hypothetical protein